jgi:hypothetical protein
MPPRLKLRPTHKRASPFWIIVYREHKVHTGYREPDRVAAEEKLQAYIQGLQG